MLGASIYRAAAGGLALAIVIGAALGIGMASWSKPINVVVVRRSSRNFLSAAEVCADPGHRDLKLGFGDGSKILLIFLGCMLPVTLGAYNGARSSERADTCLVGAQYMGAGRLPHAVGSWCCRAPCRNLLNGIRTALALSFILLVSSELIVARAGFGYLIGFLGANGAYDSMYAVVLTVALLGFAADRGFQLIMNRMLQWREQTH